MFLLCVFCWLCADQVVLIDPGSYRQAESIVQSETRGRGTLEILSLKDVDESDDFYAALAKPAAKSPAAAASGAAAAAAAEGQDEPGAAASVEERLAAASLSDG